jgi:parallel beta-helix repeat protein
VSIVSLLRLAPLLIVAALLGIARIDETAAAPPPNDNLVGAGVISLPGGSAAVSTVEATFEPGEPAPSCGGSQANSIWFKVQAPNTETVTADTVLTSYDNVLAVYSGPASSPTFGALVPVACNDNYPGSVGARLSFPVTAGTWYYFQIGRVGGSAGDVLFRIGVVTNDNLTDAQVITTPQVPGQVGDGNLFMSTIETGETACSGSSIGSIWYKWTSPATNGHAVFDTWGSGVDTILGVYTGSGFPLTQVACNDEYDVWDAPGPSLAPVFFTGATTFYIRISQYCTGLGCAYGGGGAISLNMSLGSTLVVTQTDDGNVSDIGLNLREAMLMTQGALGRAPHIEEDQLTGIGIPAGMGSTDLIHVDFRCGGLFCIGPTEVNLGSSLPALADTGDVISNKGRSMLLDGQDLNINCITVPGNSNRIEGLWMYNCDGASFPAAIRVTGSNNVIGPAPAGPGLPFVRRPNRFYQNGVGVAFNSPGTGNRLIGSEFGIDHLAGAAANDVSIAVTGANNIVGGAGADGNTIRASVFEQIVVRNATATGNVIAGNRIGGLGVSSSWGIRVDTSSTNNAIGGTGAGEGNVISDAGIEVLIQSGTQQIRGNTITGNLNIQGPSSNNVIGGSVPGARNVISGNTLGEGLYISNSNGNVVKGNYIGTDGTGTTAVPNATGIGVYDSANTTIGGAAPGEGNVVSGNTDAGIWIDNSSGNNAIPNVVMGNLIGTDATGLAALANDGAGIAIENSDGNVIGGVAAGERNKVANNGGDGVFVGTGATGNAVRGNWITANTGLGINNEGGGNGEPGHAAPVITVTGYPGGTACANCTVDVYSDESNEGRIYEGTVTANEFGNWQLLVFPAGPYVTATATNAGGSTSEFSSPLCVDYDFDGVCAGDNCPKWANAAQNLPNWTVPANDADCDGFNATVEAHVGTDPALHCSANTTPNNEPVDAWPTDFNDSRLTSLADVVLMGAAYNQPTGTDPAKRRFDLNASGNVSLADVVLMGPFYNKGCS